jgi:hypothetical protein
MPNRDLFSSQYLSIVRTSLGGICSFPFHLGEFSPATHNFSRFYTAFEKQI